MYIIINNIVTQTWDLYLRQRCYTQKLWRCQIKRMVALTAGGKSVFTGLSAWKFQACLWSEVCFVACATSGEVKPLEVSRDKNLSWPVTGASPNGLWPVSHCICKLTLMLCLWQGLTVTMCWWGKGSWFASKMWTVVFTCSVSKFNKYCFNYLNVSVLAVFFFTAVFWCIA